jgi:hypothetical protein
MSQSNLAFHLFRDQACEELKDIVKEFPTPHIFTSPSFLTNYMTLLTGRPISPLGSIRGDNGSVIVVTPADRDSILEVCVGFRCWPRAVKVLLVIPRNTVFVEQVLESQSFSGTRDFAQHAYHSTQIIFRDFHADFVPVDVDFFLMPCVRSFYQCAVEGDFTDLYSAARALAKIQTVFGAIPKAAIVGESAKRVYDLMEGILSQIGSRAQAPQIDTLILIDRMADLVTPLKTTWTVEGVIDDVFGIRYGYSVIPVKKGQPPELRKLDEENESFKNVRHLTGVAAADFLKAKEGERKAIQEELGQSRGMDVHEYKDLALRAAAQVKLLRAYEETNVYLNDLLDRQKAINNVFVKVNEQMVVSEGKNSMLLTIADGLVTLLSDWDEALRILCLDGAIGKNDEGAILKIQKELVAEFGLKAMNTILILEKLKILSTSAPQKTTWGSIIKELRCVEDATSSFVADCDDYVPPTVRIVENVARRALGQKHATARIVELFGRRGVPVTLLPEGAPPPPPEGAKNILVFFVGGVTVHEVAYIRALGRTVLDGAVNFIVGSTDQVNRKGFLRQICPGLLPPLPGSA